MDLPSLVLPKALPSESRTRRALEPLLEAADPCPDVAELAVYHMNGCIYFNKMLKCLEKLGELIRKKS